MDNVEILGSPYCGACQEVLRILTKRNEISYTFHNVGSDRGKQLEKIQDEDGSNNIPSLFINNEFLGEGFRILDIIDKRYNLI